MRRSLVVLALLLAGCASGSPADSGVPSVIPSVSPDAGVLPVGKSALPVSGVAYSPVDFVPALRLTVPAGWVSTHRGDDGFDLSRPDPAKDAPLVVVALVTPTEATAAEALATLRTRLGSVQDVQGTVGGVAAQGFDVVGGTGPLVASPAGTLALDRVPGQRARVLALDLDDVPLLVVTVVPDGSRFTELLPTVDALLQGIVRG